MLPALKLTKHHPLLSGERHCAGAGRGRVSHHVGSGVPGRGVARHSKRGAGAEFAVQVNFTLQR